LRKADLPPAALHKLPTIRLHYNQLLLLLLGEAADACRRAPLAELCVALLGCCGAAVSDTNGVAILATPAVRILPNG